jgi:putative transposase
MPSFSTSETCYRNQPFLSSENEKTANMLIDLTEDESDWGFGMCFDYLRNVKGLKWNNKRVYRIYCELSLNLRIKPRRRLKCNKPELLQEPTKPE